MGRVIRLTRLFNVLDNLGKETDVNLVGRMSLLVGRDENEGCTTQRDLCSVLGCIGKKLGEEVFSA